MLMLMLMTTIDYYHSLCLLFLSGGFLKRDTPKPPWVSILKLSIVTKWKLFHVIWNIFQIWETAALFQKYSRFMFRNSRTYEKKPDLKSWKYSRNSSLCLFFWMTTQATPTKHKPRHPEKAFGARAWIPVMAGSWVHLPWWGHGGWLRMRKWTAHHWGFP